jgi:NodT family efflux transporter outer membrane factor (OMF) lipoprotein
VAGGEAQRYVTTEPPAGAMSSAIRADWWTLLQSPALNRLIEQALAANPNVEAAQAALRSAQALVDAQRGYAWPSVQAGYTPTRTKIAGNQGGNSPGVQGDGSVISAGQGTPANAGGSAPFNAPVIYNFHTAQLSVGYTPDVFGSNKRQVESLQAQAELQRFQLEATSITISTNIVAAAVQDASLRQQIATSEAVVAAAEAALGLVQRQLNVGYASRLDLANQAQALAQARAALPPLRKQLEQNRDLLRALAGATPDTEVPAFRLDGFVLPQELPLSLPSLLVEQRPDVRAAEAQLQSASAQVGVAHAARLPQFSMSANAGGAAASIGQMFWNSGRFFDLALNVTQPLFDAGTLKSRERAAQENLQQAAAQYRAAVITAFQNVADTLQAVQADAEGLQAAAEVAATADVALSLTRRQHASGYLDRLALINAEQSARQAQLALAQARALRLLDTAALFQSLGGGWWNRPGAVFAAAMSPAASTATTATTTARPQP